MREPSLGTTGRGLNTRGRRPGICEVGLGITLRQVIFDLAGGMADGQTFKAVQVGGPLGGLDGIPDVLINSGTGADSAVPVNAVQDGKIAVGESCPGDADGDGVPNSADHCPKGYNLSQHSPTRPVPPGHGPRARSSPADHPAKAPAPVARSRRARSAGQCPRRRSHPPPGARSSRHVAPLA